MTTERIVTDEELDSIAAQAEALLTIIRDLKDVAPERRLRILKAASILAIGVDVLDVP